MLKPITTNTNGAARDAQRSALYAWETDCPEIPEAAREATLSLQECAALAALCADRYGLPAPAIGDGRGRRSACATFDGELRMPRWARSPWVVIHEAAHYVATRVYGMKIEGHGPEFVRVFVDLLAAELDLSADALRDAAFYRGELRVSPRTVDMLTHRDRRKLTALRLKAEAWEARRVKRYAAHTRAQKRYHNTGSPAALEALHGARRLLNEARTATQTAADAYERERSRLSLHHLSRARRTPVKARATPVVRRITRVP